MPTPKAVTDILKSIDEPHVGKNIVDAGMIKSVKVTGKKVHIKLKPPAMGCEGCGMIHMMIEEITTKLKKKGYTAQIEIVF